MEDVQMLEDPQDHVQEKNPSRKLKSCSSLYDISLNFVSQNIHCFYEQLQRIPLTNLVDIFEKLYQLRLSSNLQCLMSNLPLLERIIKHPCHCVTLYRSSLRKFINASLIFFITENGRKTIHKCFHLVLEKEKDFDFFLASQKIAECQRIRSSSANESNKNITKFIHEIIVLGSFFAEHGKYRTAYKIFECIDLNELDGNAHPTMLTIAFEVGLRVAHILTIDCDFSGANQAILNSSILLSYLQNAGVKPNCAFFYTTCSMYMFSLSQYDKAFNLVVQAVREISCELNPKVIVDTLRQACKVCIIKRIFSQAHSYINEALKLAKYWFGSSSPKYADCLADYAFYLISVDSVNGSVKFYENSLKIRQTLFGDNNLITAMTHEDLAYAIYVRDYSNGAFEESRVHAEGALRVMVEVLPEDHLLLSSVKRVQALILEEIALESNNTVTETRLLGCAEKLHLDSLRLARKSFGECNVQTAKHYGNLGRLYQSMKRFKEAEIYHLKAIEIKEGLLGKEHYEVALSIGHLASLYNYDMKKYDLAEQLYLRSITIGRKLFGVWYSGLEYDYRGLIHLYINTSNLVEMSKYQLELYDWEHERNNKVFKQPTQLNIDMDSDVNIKSVLSDIKKHALYGSGSSGTKS